MNKLVEYLLSNYPLHPSRSIVHSRMHLRLYYRRINYDWLKNYWMNTPVTIPKKKSEPTTG